MADDTWFDEIDLDPEGTWLRMGTRQLGSRPWLVVDGNRQAELELKAELLRDRFDEVFGVETGGDPELTRRAGRQALDLIVAELTTRAVGSGPVGAARVEPGPRADDGGLARHPLDEAGGMTQEDLCLLRPESRPGGDGSVWVLAAASLCFPSRWRLAEKLGHPLDVVHGPVAGFQQVLTRRVDSLLDRLRDGIVWRRNWFIHPDPSLFQPDRPPAGDPVIPADRCLVNLHLRSERQTLRTLPGTGYVLFTIKTDQTDLAGFLTLDERRATFARFIEEAPTEILSHRGLSPEQVTELRSRPAVG